MKDKYDIFVNPTGGVNEDYVLRVAHIGDTTIEDNKMLVETMKSVIKKRLQVNNMVKVITYGTYDLFHEGHYNLLKKCKSIR